MPQIGWTELLLLAVVAILVIGPKDLPYFLKSIGKHYNKMRSIARDFQRSINDVTKETGIEDIKKDVTSLATVWSRVANRFQFTTNSPNLIQCISSGKHSGTILSQAKPSRPTLE